MEDSGLGPKEKLDREKEEEQLGTRTGPTLMGAWTERSGADQRVAG